MRDLKRWDLLRFLDLSLTTRLGLMKSDLIIEKLRRLVGDQQIEDLAIPFTAVATDIVQRRGVWLSSGDLFDVIHASMAIPGLFTPQNIDGRSVVVGGLLNPIPVAPAMDDNNALTIAVSLAGTPVINPLGPLAEHVMAAEAQPENRSRIEAFLSTVQSVIGLESNEQKSIDMTVDTESFSMNMSDVLIDVFDTRQTAVSRYRLAA